VIRQHDVQVLLAEDGESDVLGEGTFRVVLTRSRRVITAIDIPDSALGPLHLVFAVSPQSMMRSSFQTAGFFDDLGHTINHAGHDVGHGLGQAAEATFNAGSKVATTLARPAFDITRDAAAAGASLIAHTPFVSGKDRKKLEAASRTIMRARLGDINAQQFIRAVAKAAKDGQHTAQHVGDALIDGTKIVNRILDAPMELLVSKLPPSAGGVIRGLDPFMKMNKMADKLKAGDFEGIKKDIESDAKAAQGVISLIPGIGTGISAAISVGVGILEGGGALDIAIEAAYGAIPIPAGIRQITDAVLGAVLELIHHPHNLTDALLAGARNAVPAGMARDVFDTLANLIFKHMPVAKAAGQLVDTYVERYAGGAPIKGIGSAAASMADAAMHHQNVGVAATGAVADMAKKNAPGALGEVIAGAAHVAGAAMQGKNVGVAVSDAVGGAARKIAPGALGETLAGAANVAGAVARGRNVGAAVGDAVGGAVRKIAPGALGETLAGVAHAGGQIAQGKNVGAVVGDAVGDAARKVAPGALGEGLAGAAHIAGAAAGGRNVGAALGDAVGSAARKVAPGALGEGLAGAAHIAGAAVGGKNVGAALGDAVGSAARKVAPGTLGEALAGGAHIAGAAAAGRNVLSAVGDVAGKLAPGVVGPSNPLLAAGNTVARLVPGAMGDAVAKYLPGGVGHGAAPWNPAQRAIPLPSSFSAAMPMLPPAAGMARSPLLLPPSPSPSSIHPVGAALSAALGLTDPSHGSTPVATIEDTAKGLVPGAGGAVAAQAADLGAAPLAALGGQS
jgi:hypothetical protein